MNHSNDLENLKDLQAEHREKKKRPRMRQHGQSLKRASSRSVRHIAKVERSRKL